MSSVAVIAHAGKSIDGGLPELRRDARRATASTTRCGRRCRRAGRRRSRCSGCSSEGAELFFVWGGDGMAQRCVDALAGTEATIAIVPCRYRQSAGHEPRDPQGHRRRRSRSGLRGAPAPIDVGRMNGERFAVMAGAGFDADMIRGADGGLKDRVGRAALHVDGAKSFRTPPFTRQDQVDGAPGSAAGELHPGRQRRRAVRRASRCSRTPSRTTVCSTSRRSQRTALPSGRDGRRARSPARPTSRRTSA